MSKTVIVFAVSASLLAGSLASTPVQAGWRGGGLAAGIIGFAAGAILAHAARPRYVARERYQARRNTGSRYAQSTPASASASEPVARASEPVASTTNRCRSEQQRVWTDFGPKSKTVEVCN